MVTKPCSGDDCFEIITLPNDESGLLSSFKFQVLCESCWQKHEEKKARDASKLNRNRLAAAFDAICPPLYRDTDLKRIYGLFSEASENWNYQPTGLLFEGKAGTGKTRAAWNILKRMTMLGKKCYGLTCTQLAKYSADQWHEDRQIKGASAEALELCRNAKVLLLDDLGKQKMTERAELELFDILEHRTNSMLPTIITTNSSGDQLKRMFSEDRGNPILRRIVSFSTIIKYDK